MSLPGAAESRREWAGSVSGGRRQNQTKVETMEAASPRIPTFGNNPGNFRRQISITFTGVLVRMARCVCRGAFREGLHAGIAGLCNVSNQLLRGSSCPRFCCSCCGRAAYAFVHLSNRLGIAWHSVCPVCDSRSRHRGLAVLLPKILGESTVRQRVLHFAPEVVLRNVLVKLSNLEYRTTDLFVKDVDYPGEDIERLSFPNRSFDVVLCNHVLEYVGNDEAAMAELSRILTPIGVAVITIPGDWRRKETITFPNTDLNGCYRDYGMDVTERFQQYFETVEVFDLHALDRATNGLAHGIRPNDVAFICRQPRGVLMRDAGDDWS